MRQLASLGHYIATTHGEGVQIHQYTSGALRAGGLELTVHTGYPWDGTVTIEVTGAPARERSVSLRVPAWCPEATLDAADALRAGGYPRVRRMWRAGDQLVLGLPMPPG